MKHMSVWGTIVLSLLFLTSSAGSAKATELSRQAGKPQAGSHMKVSGVVSQVKSGIIVVKTPWGQMTVSAASGLEDVEVGEEVIVWMNENNAVIDVHRKDDPHPLHRHIIGNLVYASKDKAEIKLSTPEGEQAFPVERGKSRLSTIEEGAPILVEINEAGKVIDVHRLAVDVDMNLEEMPRTKPGHHITMDGIITNIQSGIVSVKTPVARYTISAKTLPNDIKIGDELSAHQRPHPTRNTHRFAQHPHPRSPCRQHATEPATAMAVGAKRRRERTEPGLHSPSQTCMSVNNAVVPSHLSGE